MKTPPVSENEATSAGIDAWLSGRATRAERRGLSNAVKNNPAAARALAEQAGTEADLGRWKRGDATAVMVQEMMHNAEARVPLRRRVFRLSTALAAVLLAAGAYASWMQRGTSDGSPEAAVTLRPGPKTEGTKVVVSAGAKPQSAPAEEALSDGSELQKLLSRYRLPDGAGFQGEKVSLQTAVAMIESAIRRANVTNNPALKPLRIRIENPENLPEDRFVSFRAGSIRAASLLEALAVMADAELSFRPDTVFLTLKKIPEANGDGGEMATRVYRAPADFVTRVIPPAPLSEEEKAQAADPFLPTEERIQPVSPDDGSVQAEFVRLHDLTFPPGSEFKFSAAASRLTLTAPQRDLDRTGSALSHLFFDSPSQVFLTTKFIELPDRFVVKDQILDDTGFQMLTREWSQTPGVDLLTAPLKDQILDDAGFQMLMRELSQTKGVDLLTAPSLIIRDGQSGKAEVIREVALPDGLTDWTGIQVPVKAVVTGEAIMVEASPLVRDRIQDSIQSREVEVSATLRDRQTAIFVFPSAVPGRQLIGAVTTVLLDPSGQPVDPAAVIMSSSGGIRSEDNVRYDQKGNRQEVRAEQMREITAPPPAPANEEMERDPDKLWRTK